MTKIIMCGCNGHMGQVVSGLCKEDPEVEIVAGIDAHNQTENDYPVFAGFAECTIEADVIIDFSHVSMTESLLAYSVEHQTPVVFCTTGLSEEQLKSVEKAWEKVAILKSANMSLGINMLYDLLAQTAKILAPAGFDMEIVEKHHNQKLDAPSGTALALADAVRDALPDHYDYIYDRSQERKKRAKNEIGIAAVRGGNIVGEHEVIFAGLDEVITFEHTAYSKSLFGKGAIEAAKFLKGKPAGHYDMRDVVKAKA